MLTGTRRKAAYLTASILRWIRRLGKVLAFVMQLVQFGIPQRPRSKRQLEGLVVSLTSTPKRIGLVWMTIKSIERQTLRPAEIVLILAADQFPDMKVPRSLRARIKEGLTVVFEQGDRGSYKKLVPVLQRFPDYSIITVDDDVLYRKRMIERFLEAASEAPQTIIGSRGRTFTMDGNITSPYSTWPLASRTKDGGVVLTGHGGVLYPAGVFSELPEDAILSGERLCPNADDIWFWAMALATRRSRMVTKKRFYVPNILMSHTPRLSAKNNFLNDKYIAEALNYFGIEPERAQDG